MTTRVSARVIGATTAARVALAVAAAGIVAACDGASHSAPMMTAPTSIVVYNHLVAPVSIAIDGVPALGLKSGASSGMTIPAGARVLTWTSAEATGSDGQPIPDDLGAVTMEVAGINRVLDIVNVINDQPYITASIVNRTNRDVSIGVYDGTTVSCAAELPASSETRTGFTMTGYYRLLATTEIRAYRDASGCRGPYFAWPAVQLRSYVAKSGSVTLSLESAP